MRLNEIKRFGLVAAVLMFYFLGLLVTLNLIFLPALKPRSR